MVKHRNYELLRHLGSRFQTIRKAAGRTQEQTAEAMGIQPTSLSRWERGRCGLSLSVLHQGASFLGVGLGDLLDISREVPELMAEELRFLEMWKGLDNDQRQLVMGVVEQMFRGEKGGA